MRNDDFSNFDLEGLDLAGLFEEEDELELLELPVDRPREKQSSESSKQPEVPKKEETPLPRESVKKASAKPAPRKETAAPEKKARPEAGEKKPVKKPSASKPAKSVKKTPAPKKEAAPKPPKKTGTKDQLIRLFFNVLEGILVAFLVVFVAWMFNKDTAKDVDMDVIHQEILENCELGELVEGDANTLKRYFSLDGAVYESYLVYTADSVMNVEELLIVKTTDSSQLTDLREVAETRVAEQIQNFDGYGTNQKELLENAVILEQGDYFFYCVSEYVEQVEDTFLSCIK